MAEALGTGGVGRVQGGLALGADLTGLALPFLRVVGQGGSELAGPAFSPDGSRLYFSSQRGRDGRGITYEVSGPFRALLRKEA